MQHKKTIMAITLVACLAVAFFAIGYQAASTDIYIDSQLGMMNSVDNNPVDKKTDIHCRLRIYQHGTLISDTYHAGVVTDIGDNATLAKLFGDSSYNLTQYNLNATYISIGNYSSIDATATVLPSEWNRTAGTISQQAQSTLNISATIYPDSSGPYTADCIGLNFDAGIGSDDNLFAYDTFAEVTGIDETFTINIEFSVSVSHT